MVMASMLVVTSMRFGATPIWKMVPGVARSSGERSESGAPNFARARKTRPAISGEGRTQMSRSFV